MMLAFPQAFILCSLIQATVLGIFQCIKAAQGFAVQVCDATKDQLLLQRRAHKSSKLL